ncbi:MAG: dihydroneopterin aldolase, partial [Lachnospiraceae bacterium]|nr:dihydroneopterin aldolase [Lachnospiraceae bacterium]
MGQIVINGLNVFGHHGVYEQEKANGQNFIVNIVADTSFEEAQKSDDLSKTIDYGTMC